METHRCRRREEEKEEGVSIFKKMKAIYRGWRVKKCAEAIITSKKRVKTRFFDLPTIQKRFVCGADHRPNLLVQFRMYNPDFIFRKNTIMAWTKGNLGLCVCECWFRF